MMDYNTGARGNDFSAQPRVMQQKYRFKDPYGQVPE
jgi:hypothetical protein